MWVWAFRICSCLHSVNTNNGVESCHDKLKRYYVTDMGKRSLCEVIGIMVDRYLPDVLRSYLEQNVACSGLWRKGSEDLDVFLHGWPANFINAIKEPLRASMSIMESDVISQSDGKFTVQGEAGQYMLNLAGPFPVPTCTCPDFLRKRRMCKHILAVLRLGNWQWKQLPEEYASSVFLNCDRAAIGIEEEVPESEPSAPSVHVPSPQLICEVRCSLTLDFQGQIFNSHILGMGSLIVLEWKRCESHVCWKHSGLALGPQCMANTLAN